MIDIKHLQSWIGCQQVVEDPLPVFPARALAAALSREQLPEQGDSLPPSWHWLHFLETPSGSGTGVDGHPLKGGFLPPVPLPRRMWASGQLQIEQPLSIGVPAQRQSRVATVELKEGRSGSLVFVTLEHLLFQRGECRIRELQHLVYRDAPSAAAPLPPGQLPVAESQWERVLNADPVLLFRFSALTYNAHRIHYDRDYAMQEEFYPGLVVQGPLLATSLLELAIEHTAPDAVRDFEFRAMRPTFAPGPIRLCGRRDGQQLQLWSLDQDGFVGMSARATVRN
ncbi:hypothetical protein AAIH51_15190 [Pseudomonas aeruginosa]|uniref:hypothetical protein n=1 Tax=Pseudomonas aeruginosa TaxID=287 RepID=UPI0031B6D94F